MATPWKIVKEPHEFKRTNFNHKRDYIEQSAILLNIENGTDMNSARATVKKAIANHPKVMDPQVTFYKRDIETGDRSVKEASWDSYCDAIVSANEQMSASFTGYVDKDKLLSILAKMVDGKMAERKVYKKEKFQASVRKDIEAENFNQVMQVNKKTEGNALSGNLGSHGTVLHNRSAHAALTSTARIATSTSNGALERTLASSRHYASADIVIGDILAVLECTDLDLLKHTIEKYDMVYPTATQAFGMVKDNSRSYWSNQSDQRRIQRLLLKMTPLQIAAFCYIGDLHFVRELNPKLFRSIIDSVIHRETPDTPMVDVANRIEKDIPEDILNFVHHLYMKELSGRGVVYQKMDSLLVTKIYMSGMHTIAVLRKYHTLFTTIISTNHFAPHVAYIKEMVRSSIPASDTDSALASISEWVQWYQGHNDLFTEDSMALVGFIGYLASNTLDHYLRLLSVNLGIRTADIDIIKMKNEYTFTFFAMMSNAKHYFAKPAIIEKNVLVYKDYVSGDIDSSGIDSKGVALKNSNTPFFVRQRSEDIKVYIDTCLTTNKKISVYYILRIIRDTEQIVLKSLASGNPEFLRFNNIKEASAYKQEDPKKNPFQWNVFWNTTFNVHGTPVVSPYKSAKIPTTLVNKTKLKEWIESIEDTVLKTSIIKWVQDHNKSTIPTIYVPMEYAVGKGVPKEILPILDRNRVVLDIVNMMYLILETLSIYTRPGLTISDEYSEEYIEKKLTEYNVVITTR